MYESFFGAEPHRAFGDRWDYSRGRLVASHCGSGLRELGCLELGVRFRA